MKQAATWCLIDIKISLVSPRWSLLLDALAGAGASAVGSPLMSLEVQIEKKLLDFTLEVSFRAEAEPLSILGASGAGKTMLLRCIAGLERPDRRRNQPERSCVLRFRIASANIPARQRRVSMLFQKLRDLFHITPVAGKYH